MTSANLLIVGCGDIGRRVAQLAGNGDRHIYALVRSPESLERLEGLAVTPLSGDLLDPETLLNLPTRGALVLYLAPPPGGGISDPKLRNFCASLKAGEEPAKIVYVSTSGVYGDCRGAIVTEATPPHPQTARSKRRFDAENTLRHFSEERGVPVVILRVTGIYGPNRLPLNRLVEGHPVLREEEAPFTNRIHADDLAQVCLRALELGADGEIFNVSDGEQSTMTDYFNRLADLLELPRPPQVSLSEARQVMTPLMLSYVQESRRMDNRKMLQKLGVTLRYPTLQAGLEASLAEMRQADPELLRNLRGRT